MVPSTDSSHGTCFGLEVRSREPFRYLRDGPGIPLAITEATERRCGSDGELVIEWPPRGAGGGSRLHRDGTSFRFWIDGPGWFEVDPSLPSITIPALPSQTLRAQLAPGVPEDQLLAWREAPMWGIPAMLCFMEQGYLPLHAASVDVGAGSVLLGAPGTFGKTTLAGAFHNAGHRLLSDDITACGLGPNPVVFPGPALLRVRRDVFERVEFPDTKPAFENPLRVGLAINESRRGDAGPLPLRAIVLLRRPADEMSLVRADPVDAIRDLLALCFRGVLDRRRAFEEVASLVNTIPVWYLTRQLDYGELPAVVDRIVNACINPVG
jgi:hypothetical protein